MHSTWAWVTATALALLALGSFVHLLATGAGTTALVAVGAAVVVLGVASEVLGRRRLHAAVGLDQLGFSEANAVLREARGGPLPQDPAARAEAMRVVAGRQRFLDRFRGPRVLLLAVVAMVGVVLLALGHLWALPIVGAAVGSGAGRWLDHRGSDQRLEQLRGAAA